MRIALCAFGTIGDVGPILGLGRELGQRGCDVVAVVNPFFAAKAAAFGLGVREVGTTWDPAQIALEPTLLNPRNVWRKVYRPQVAPMAAAVQTLHAEAGLDGVVAHTWTFGGMLGAHAARVPWATVSLAPITWFSAAIPPQLDERALPEGARKVVSRFLVRPVISAVFARGLREEARALGVDDIEPWFWESANQAALNLGLWSPSWRGPAADDPGASLIAGFPLAASDGAAPLSPDLLAWLDAGEAPIVAGFGSALPRAAAQLYQEIAAVAKARGVRAVLVGADPALADPGAGVRVEAYVPYGPLFARAAVVVHHGGVGAVATALAGGRPQLVLGFGNDQHANGARTEAAGVGRWIPASKARGKLGAAIDALSSDPAIASRATALAERIRAEGDGRARAADALLQAFAR